MSSGAMMPWNWMMSPAPTATMVSATTAVVEPQDGDAKRGLASWVN